MISYFGICSRFLHSKHIKIAEAFKLFEFVLINPSEGCSLLCARSLRLFVPFPPTCSSGRKIKTSRASLFKLRQTTLLFAANLQLLNCFRWAVSKRVFTLLTLNAVHVHVVLAGTVGCKFKAALI